MSKNRNNRPPQQPRPTMPQDNEKPAEQQAGAEQAAQSEQASQAAEETGANTGAPEGALDPQPEPNQGTGDTNPEQDQQSQGDTGDVEVEDKAKSAPVVIEQGAVDNSSAKPTTEQAKPDVAQVATAVASTSVVSTSAKEALTVFQQLMERTEAAGTPQQKALVKALVQYVERMAPGTPIAPADGAKMQQNLWMTLKSVVDNTDNLEFRKQWFIVLSFFNEYSGRRQVFNGHYVFRFADQWNRSPDDLTALQRLINLIHLTSKPEERAQGLKQVDLDRSLALGFTPMGRQNLISFYKSN